MDRARAMTVLRLLVIGVLLWPASQAGAQAQGGQPDAVTPPVQPADSFSRRALVGEVRCVQGIPEPSYADTTRPAVHGIDRAETVKHETMHVAQLLGGCDSIMAVWLRDPAVRADAEIQATCAGLEVYADTARRRQRLNAARTALMMIYARWIQPGDIYAAVEAWCR